MWFVIEIFESLANKGFYRFLDSKTILHFIDERAKERDKKRKKRKGEKYFLTFFLYVTRKCDE